MNYCVNHSDAVVTAYCQNCGKGLCSACVRTLQGSTYCEPCMNARIAAAPGASAGIPGTPGVWGPGPGMPPPPPPGPNPGTATLLGFIPGVGAMYNGQFFKGLIHVVIFAVLISITDHYGIFGIFIAAWVLYQSFEAYHTAVARRDGMPLPDPLGLNEVGHWLNLGGRTYYPGQQPPATPGAMPGTMPGAPPTAAGPATGAYQAPYANPYQQAGAYQPPPYTPVSGFPDPGFTGQGFSDPGAPPIPPPIPPIPPVPPLGWRRKEPIGAVILIGFGLLLLLHQMGYLAERVVHYLWPLIFIALGAWLIVRRVGDTKGGV